MTRAELSRDLAYIEQIRMDSYEADSLTEVRRLEQEYGRVWGAIAPYCIGERPCSDDPPA